MSANSPTEGRVKFAVESVHTVSFDPEMPAVLSTPSLIWFLEHAAIEALSPALADGETSVGTEVEVRHLAPTPIGQTVTCVARVLQVDGPEFTFQLEARDDHELIGRGFHRRRIVRIDRLARAVRRKQ